MNQIIVRKAKIILMLKQKESNDVDINKDYVM